jgi:hypothetical protein
MTDRSRCLYAANYCEENVWQLSRAAGFTQRRRGALFISNRDRHCPLWSQRAATQPDQPVVWDYHVVLLALGPAQVFDLDSTLPFPCDALDYLGATFPLADQLPEPFAPRFRFVPAEELTRTFASDRSHMRAADGAWRSPPPPWPAIATPTATMTLPAFIDMTSEGAGVRLDLRSLGALLRAEENR